jgi:large subunit ribosomal protein L9
VKVLLRDDVENLGRKGEVVAVADGYARNYLVPRGLAIRATRGVAKQAEAMQRNRAVRDAREVEAANDLAGRLAAGPVRVAARAGEEGKLFGSVTSADIADRLNEGGLDFEVDRRRIALSEPLKELGVFMVPIRLHADVEVEVEVRVERAAE